LSTGGATSWSWDFGDGATSTEREPTHTYATAGSYTVFLRVTSPSGGQDLVRPGFVAAPAPLAADFAHLCSGAFAPVTVQFQDRSLGAATSWSWDFGDGGTSTERSPAHVYGMGGWFTVRLTVGGVGEESTKATPVLINEPAPHADF